MTRCVPSCFLMELPRDEMDVSDVGDFMTLTRPADGIDAPVEFDEFYNQDEAIATHSHSSSDTSVDAAMSLQTAAEMVTDDANPESDADAKPKGSIDPDRFALGMTVMHPEYGPGKVAALSGSGSKRTGTINFATAGQKKFVLAFSGLVPVGT